jgi:hypothetical protein
MKSHYYKTFLAGFHNAAAAAAILSFWDTWKPP